MICPTDAELRAHVDVVDDHVATHAAGCASCATRLTGIRRDARLAATAIAGLDDGVRAPVDVEAAAQAAVPAPVPVGATRLRLPLSVAAGVVALLVAVLVVGTPTGRRAAADFLAGFRSERFEVVTFDPDQPTRSFDGLEEVVDVEADHAELEPTEVDSPDEAAEVAGFTPGDVTSLPDGASLSSIQASAPGTVRMTFRADRAPELPAALDGARLIVSMPGTVAQLYDVDGRALVIGEAGQLTVDAEGADLATIREYLLSRPEVPRDLADQLLAIDDWTTTVPIPIPVDDVVWQDTTVAGAPALELQDSAGSGLLWQADGRIHAVGAESLDLDALRAIADGLG